MGRMIGKIKCGNFQLDWSKGSGARGNRISSLIDQRYCPVLH